MSRKGTKTVREYDIGNGTNIFSCCGQYGGAMVSTVASQEGLGFDSQPGQGLPVFWLHPTVQRHAG